MASLKDLRNRIASVKATRKITKAMQMVAAAKLRRAQEAAEASRPYAERMDAVLANLAKGVANPENASPILVGTGKDENHLLIMMTAERGLCGGFNSNIAKLVRQDARRLGGNFQARLLHLADVARLGAVSKFRTGLLRARHPGFLPGLIRASAATFLPGIFP